MVSVTVRNRVLGYLREHPDASAAQIGRGLGLETPSVRYHLGSLCRDGAIIVAGARGRRTRGRPTKVYRLSERLRGDNLCGLAAALLNELRSRPRPQRAAALGGIVKGLEDQVGSVAASQGASAKTLGLLVDRLTALHYEASWEAGSEGPRLLFAHCPYAEIIEAHPELCQIDAGVLERKLGVPVLQLSKIDPRLGGPAHCVFALQRSTTSASSGR